MHSTISAPLSRTPRRAKAGSIALGFVALALAAAGPGHAVKKRAFVTSVSGSGELGSWPDAGNATGLNAGDVICQVRATAGGLPNGTAFRAWLSTSETDAYCHLRGQTGKKPACEDDPPAFAGPWYLANGVTNFAADLDALTDSRREIYRPVLMDEFQNPLDRDLGSRYWTGTRADGEASGLRCSDWTSPSAAANGSTGEALGSATSWTDDDVESCDGEHRLLCLEIGPSETHTLRWSPGSLAFVTTSSGTGNLLQWPDGVGESSGLAAGDAICRAHAERGGLPEPQSFVAWLSTSGIDARDRISSPGPFRRIDGYSVANSLADLTDGANANSLHVDEAGAYIHDQGKSWTGTGGDGERTAHTCGDWEVTAAHFGLNGLASYARDGGWTSTFVSPCASIRRLYCFSNVITLFWDGFELTGDTSRWSEVMP